MKMNPYTVGTDILVGWSEAPIKLGSQQVGASIIPLASVNTPQPALVIRVKNPAELVAKQGGAAGKLSFDIAPSSITGLVYSKMRDEMLEKFKEKGVVADVQVVTSPPSGPPPKAEFVRGMAAGGMATGIVYGLYRLVKAFL